MLPKEPTEPRTLAWGAPLTIAAVVGGLVIWRACTGRGDEATVRAAPSATASATDAVTAPPPAPRCTELSPEPFMIGEPSPRKPPPAPIAPVGAPDEQPEEAEDDLAPFAVELGRASVFEGGFAAGARRDAEGGAVAMVATMGLDGRDGKLIRLGRSRGDLDPPVVVGAGSAVLAALLEPNAGGRTIKIAKVVGTEVTWGVELAEGRDESLAIDLAAAGARALVVWDDVTREEKRSSVMLASFDVATMRSVTPTRPVSSPRTDADTPRLVVRPGGGYWLAYIARADEVKRPAKTSPPAAAKAPSGSDKARHDGKDDDGDNDEAAGETISNAWIEVLPLDENGAPTATPRAVTPRDGHVLAYDIELGEGGAALLAYRDDDTPTGSIGGRLSSALIRLGGGAVETHVLAEESFGAGVPDLLPGWLALSGGNGATRIASLSAKGELRGPLAPEPVIGTGEPLAASGDRILVARPAGKAMRVGVVRCSPSLDTAPPVKSAAP